mgnify:FL=1
MMKGLNMINILNYINNNKKNIIFITAFIILSISIFVLVKRYMYKNKYEPLLIKKDITIKPFIINENKMIKSDSGNQLAFSFWIFMDSVSGSENWNSNYYDQRNILHKGKSPGLLYIPELNLYRISIKTKTDDDNIEMFDIKNVKLQQWVHFVISLNNRTLDVFIDGKLKHSFVTSNVPILNDRSLIFGSIKTKVNGKLTNLRYFNKSLDVYRVKKLYNADKHKLIPNPSVFWWIFN